MARPRSSIETGAAAKGEDAPGCQHDSQQLSEALEECVGSFTLAHQKLGSPGAACLAARGELEAYEEGHRRAIDQLVDQLFVLLGPKLIERVEKQRKDDEQEQEQEEEEEEEEEEEHLAFASRNSRSRTPEITLGQAIEDSEDGDVWDVPMGSEDETPGHTTQKRGRRMKEGKGAGRTRTVEFDDVFQDGHPDRKQLIVRHPRSNGHFYVLRCQEHGVSFNKASSALEDGAAHLGRASHGIKQARPRAVIRELGVLVLGCSASLAKKNNALFQRNRPSSSQSQCRFQSRSPSIKRKRALSSPQQTEQPRKRSKMSSPRPSPPPDTAEDSSDSGESTPSPSQSSTAIVNPIPGDIYFSLSDETRSYVPVMILPTNRLEDVGVPGTLASLGLMDDLPRCLVKDRRGGGLSWAAGYGEGGRPASKRAFPAIYLTSSRFPARCPVAWVAASNLQQWDLSSRNMALRMNEHYDVLRAILRKRERAQARGEKQPVAAREVDDGETGEGDTGLHEMDRDLDRAGEEQTGQAHGRLVGDEKVDEQADEQVDDQVDEHVNVEVDEERAGNEGACEEQVGGKVDEEHVGDGRVDTDGVVNERTDDEPAVGEQAGKGRTDGERVDAVQADDGQVVTERVDAERIDAVRLDHDHVDDEQVDADKVDDRQNDNERIDAERVDDGVEGDGVEDDRTDGEQINDGQVADERLDEDQSVGEQVVDEQTVVEQLIHEQLVQEQLVDERVVDERVVDERLDHEDVGVAGVDLKRPEDKVDDERVAEDDVEAIEEPAEAPAEPLAPRDVNVPTDAASPSIMLTEDDTNSAAVATSTNDPIDATSTNDPIDAMVMDCQMGDMPHDPESPSVVFEQTSDEMAAQSPSDLLPVDETEVAQTRMTSPAQSPNLAQTPKDEQVNIGSGPDGDYDVSCLDPVENRALPSDGLDESMGDRVTPEPPSDQGIQADSPTMASVEDPSQATEVAQKAPCDEVAKQWTDGSMPDVSSASPSQNTRTEYGLETQAQEKPSEPEPACTPAPAMELEQSVLHDGSEIWKSMGELKVIKLAVLRAESTAAPLPEEIPRHPGAAPDSDGGISDSHEAPLGNHAVPLDNRVEATNGQHRKPSTHDMAAITSTQEIVWPVDQHEANTEPREAGKLPEEEALAKSPPSDAAAIQFESYDDDNDFDWGSSENFMEEPLEETPQAPCSQLAGTAVSGEPFLPTPEPAPAPAPAVIRQAPRSNGGAAAEVGKPEVRKPDYYERDMKPCYFITIPIIKRPGSKKQTIANLLTSDHIDEPSQTSTLQTAGVTGTEKAADPSSLIPVDQLISDTPSSPSRLEKTRRGYSETPVDHPAQPGSTANYSGHANAQRHTHDAAYQFQGEHHLPGLPRVLGQAQAQTQQALAPLHLHGASPGHAVIHSPPYSAGWPTPTMTTPTTLPASIATSTSGHPPASAGYHSPPFPHGEARQLVQQMARPLHVPGAHQAAASTPATTPELQRTHVYGASSSPSSIGLPFVWPKLPSHEERQRHSPAALDPYEMHAQRLLQWQRYEQKKQQDREEEQRRQRLLEEQRQQEEQQEREEMHRCWQLAEQKQKQEDRERRQRQKRQRLQRQQEREEQERQQRQRYLQLEEQRRQQQREEEKQQKQREDLRRRQEREKLLNIDSVAFPPSKQREEEQRQHREQQQQQQQEHRQPVRAVTHGTSFVPHNQRPRPSALAPPMSEEQATRALASKDDQSSGAHDLKWTAVSQAAVSTPWLVSPPSSASGQAAAATTTTTTTTGSTEAKASGPNDYRVNIQSMRSPADTYICSYCPARQRKQYSTAGWMKKHLETVHGVAARCMI